MTWFHRSSNILLPTLQKKKNTPRKGPLWPTACHSLCYVHSPKLLTASAISALHKDHLPAAHFMDVCFLRSACWLSLCRGCWLVASADLEQSMLMLSVSNLRYRRLLVIISIFKYIYILFQIQSFQASAYSPARCSSFPMAGSTRPPSGAPTTALCRCGTNPVEFPTVALSCLGMEWMDSCRKLVRTSQATWL